MTNISTIQVAGISEHEIMRLTFLGITLASFIVFLFFVTIMLMVYFTNHLARQEVRYVLFAHMLIGDLVYLLLSLYLFLISYYPTTYPAPFCYFFIFVSSSALKIAPYNLAVMSLERYVAICFPLRHGEICTLQRAGISFSIIWTIGLLPNVADIIILTLSVDQTFFHRNVMCDRSKFVVIPVQNTIRVVVHASTFSLVGLIIVFTYIKIMLVALRVKSKGSSASKAGKTVMLHAVQLLLCMTAYSYTVFQILLKDYIDLFPIINFCFFMCLPRFISPIIYGLTDELFRKHMKRITFCIFFRCRGKVG